MKFVDITNDIAFRKIFGNAGKKKSLISFLNAVIALPGGKKIADVEITTPYQLGRLSAAKVTIVDVKAIDDHGNHYIIEMQVLPSAYFHKRILHYTAQSYANQLNKAENYDKLKPVYFIGILEFEIGKSQEYFSKHQVLNVETHERIVQDIEFNFIELTKFDKAVDQLESPIDQWTYFIKNADKLDLIPENVQDEGLREAYLEADLQTWTQPELDDYDSALRYERDVVNQQIYAEQKGRSKQLREVAKAMKEDGVSVAQISRITKLTEEEIEKL